MGVLSVMRGVIASSICMLGLARDWSGDAGDVGKIGGYAAKKTIPYWTDKHVKERGEPPYKPPADWVYNTKGGPVEGKINVHLIPHTHDDTGWQVTVDQYFFQDVYYVLDTVIPRLAEDPNRKFMYVETGFFARWWDQQPPRIKNLTKTLVKNRQLEFINGGWCMHDEASPYYVEMVDQTTRGHQFLRKNFGDDAIPKGTWQIDPFGHSNTQAWLLGAESGFQSLFWGRTDYADFETRKNKSRLEWVWQGSQSLGSSAELFSGALYGGGSGGYGTWFGFNANSDEQVQDDPRRHDYNVDRFVDEFVQHAIEQDQHTQTKHQQWACGSDFEYQNADHWFHNLDKLIHYINQNGTVNAFYSTPSLYTEAKFKEGQTWERRYDDIFPLADHRHHYWTGYFTSRPALKRQVRFASNYLNAARQLEVLSGVTAEDVNTPTTRPSPQVGKSWTDSLEGTIGVATHHDGMSGTERQDVADDYAQRISESTDEVEEGVMKSLQRLMGTSQELFHCNCNGNGAADCLNVTVCAGTTNNEHFSIVAYNPIAHDQAAPQLVRIPVTGADWSVSMAGSSQVVASQVSEIDDRTKSLPLLYINYFGIKKEDIPKVEAEYANKATHVLSFSVDPPAMGYASYTAVAKAVKPKEKTNKAFHVPLKAIPSQGNPFAISSDHYSVTFDPKTGMMTSVTNVKSGITTPLSIQWGWYNSSTGGCTADDSNQKLCDDDQKSGAYMFRPNTSTVFYPGPPTTPSLHIAKGPVMTEIYQTFSSWATHVVRLIQGMPYIEVEWTAGPIPINTPWLPAATQGKERLDKWGKEVIVKYSTGLASDGVFYTDANGREMVKREFNKRGPSYPPLDVNEPIAGNYYPVNAMMSLEDSKAGTEFVVLTDVTQGGASINNGELEFMVHRRVQFDDSRGVQEPLNETMCGCNDINAAPGNMGEHGHEGDGGCSCAGLTMRGRHWLVFDKVEEANAVRRQLQESLNFPATLSFTNGDLKALRPHATGLDQTHMPANVRLVTLTNNYADINDGKLMLRLAHMYSIGEHPKLSQPASVSLTELFSKAGLKIKSAEAMSLTGNQPIEQMDASKLNWITKDVTGGKVDALINENGAPMTKRFPFDPKDPTLTVTLRPMEVRTFFVTFDGPSPKR